jgi:hypothetical protein
MKTAAHPFELELLGLREDNPRDFLAALGLFRLIDLLWPGLEAHLFWNRDAGHPCIKTNKVLPDDWSSSCLSELKGLAEPADCPLFHGAVIKTETEIYRKAVSKAVEFAGSEHALARLPQLLYASYAGQAADENDGCTEPTAFSFANGQGGKNLLRDARELILGINPDDLEACVLGKGQAIAAKSMRWNPKEYRPAAYRSHDPGTKLKGDETLDFPSFNLLAFVGLSFFPSVPTTRGSRTLGFEGNYRPDYFRWPVWDMPLATDSLQTLLCLSLSYLQREVGVLRVWQSRRFSADKSLYFAPSELLGQLNQHASAELTQSRSRLSS